METAAADDQQSATESETKAPTMETVLLNLSAAEVPSSIMSSFTKDDLTELSPASAAESAENILSKYFGLDPPAKDAEGANFFDVLAEKTTQGLKDPVVGYSDTTVQKPEEAHEVFEGPPDGKTSDPPPALLKFFAEDKSGEDQDGKAFFDKIASEDVTSFRKTEPKDIILGQISSQEQFPFTPTGSDGEAEDAWLPCEKTRQVLISLITSKTPVIVNKDLLTFPDIVVDEEMADPIKSLLVECNSPHAQARKTLSANEVTVDEAGLQKLMERGCYHAAINLTTKILKSLGQVRQSNDEPCKHTPMSLRIWYTRIALLVKLKKFNLAEAEAAPFGDLDKPDLYYEYYPDIYKGKKGTMVPFALRLLLAELPQYQGNHRVTLDNLYRTFIIVEQMICNVRKGCAEDGSMIDLPESRREASLSIWGEREKKLLYAILNCILSLKDYILATNVIRILIVKTKFELPQLRSALGRVYLQLGDIKTAEDCFGEASEQAKKMAVNFEVEENIDSALLSVAQNNNEEAYKFYEKALALDPSNAMIANNMAVCLLYTGKLGASLALLENTIQGNPALCCHEGLIFNLCTLYELESSRCAQKKIALLELASKHVGDSFGVSCFKIQLAAKS